jgi:lipoate-protein ligase A
MLVRFELLGGRPALRPPHFVADPIDDGLPEVGVQGTVVPHLEHLQPLEGVHHRLLDEVLGFEQVAGVLRQAAARPPAQRYPAISYGYLMSRTQVDLWAHKQSADPAIAIVQRPTAGGAVYHSKADLSLSLLWPRGGSYFPEKPRACYEAIHQILLHALKSTKNEKTLTLFSKSEGRCETRGENRFSVCFDEPVCNDVMAEGRKIIGGALRITKTAILYQGNILLDGNDDTAALMTKIQEKISNHK